MCSHFVVFLTNINPLLSHEHDGFYFLPIYLDILGIIFLKKQFIAMLASEFFFLTITLSQPRNCNV